MSRSIQISELRKSNRAARWFGLLALLSSGLAALAAGLDFLRADRTVYADRAGHRAEAEALILDSIQSGVALRSPPYSTSLPRSASAPRKNISFSCKVRPSLVV